MSWWIPTGRNADDVVCAYKAVGAASLAASYINLNHPGTQNAVPGSGSYQPPTWNSTNGWIFNGTDEQQYLDTNATPSHEWTFIIKYVLGSTSAWDSLCGVYNDDNTAYFSALLYNSGGDKKVTYYAGSSSSVVSADRTNGVLAIAANQGYWNGVADGAAGTVGTWHDAGATFTIGTQNIGNAGSEGIFGGINASVQCFVLYNKTLTAAEIKEIVDNINRGYEAQMTIQDVVNDIQDTIGALSGIRIAPDYPPNQLSASLAAIVYPASGVIGAQSDDWMKELHVVNIDLVTPAKDLTRDMTLLNPFLRSIPNALMNDSTFGATASTFDSISYSYITFEDGAIPYRGYRFVISGIKLEPSIV